MRHTIHTMNIMAPFAWMFMAAIGFLIGDDVRSAVWGFVIGYSLSFGIDLYGEIIVALKNRYN